MCITKQVNNFANIREKKREREREGEKEREREKERGREGRGEEAERRRGSKGREKSLLYENETLYWDDKICSTTMKCSLQMNKKICFVSKKHRPRMIKCAL
jgi:hypothetical protein